MNQDENTLVCQYPEFGSICGLPLPSKSPRYIQRYSDFPLLPVCIRHYVLHEWLQQHDRDLSGASEIFEKENLAQTLVLK